jgi:hypothetical protein
VEGPPIMPCPQTSDLDEPRSWGGSGTPWGRGIVLSEQVIQSFCLALECALLWVLNPPCLLASQGGCCAWDGRFCN